MSSYLIRGTPREELPKLKEQSGKDILVLGSPTLVRWLLHEHSLDELDLLILPVTVGGDKRMFSDDGDQVALKLTGSETFSTGVVHLTYRPATDGPTPASLGHRKSGKKEAGDSMQFTPLRMLWARSGLRVIPWPNWRTTGG